MENPIEPASDPTMADDVNRTTRRRMTFAEAAAQNGESSYGNDGPVLGFMKRRRHSFPATLSHDHLLLRGSEALEVFENFQTRGSEINAPSDGHNRSETNGGPGNEINPQPRQLGQEKSFQSLLRSQFSIWSLAIFTSSWVAFTVYFAYNCSLEVPQAETLIFSEPQWTILTLAILSQLTIFLLAELTNSVFEIVRWTFVSSERGLPALSFFALGTSTTSLGLLMVLWNGFKNHQSNCNSQRKWLRDGPRVWSFQRYRLLICVLKGDCSIPRSEEFWG